MKEPPCWLVLFVVLFAPALWSGDVTIKPRDAAKEAWVRGVQGRLGVNGEIRVVRDDDLTGTTTCAYATHSGGTRYIAYDPMCVTTLTPGEINYVWSKGVMLHELAHHAWNHGFSSKPPMAREIEAEQWAGSAFRKLDGTLEEASIYARAGLQNATQTHPGLSVRFAAVERGWREADGQLGGGRISDASLPGANGTVESLANAARLHLRALSRNEPRP